MSLFKKLSSEISSLSTSKKTINVPSSHRGTILSSFPSLYTFSFPIPNSCSLLNVSFILFDSLTYPSFLIRFEYLFFPSALRYLKFQMLSFKNGRKHDMNHEEKTHLFQTVFAPRPRERVLFLVDIPKNPTADTTTWKDRRAMAQEWFTIFKELGIQTGFTVHFQEYPATGIPNTPIPQEILKAAKDATLVIAMTEYSASSSLLPICFSKNSHTRCASMPGVERRMEETAFRADYTAVKHHATRLAQLLNDATAADIHFSTGDTLRIDLRHRIAKADTGDCTTPGQFINFPSGEACKVPYEAAPDEITRYGESTTQGIWPVHLKGEPMQWIVKHNRVIDIIGTGPHTEKIRQFFKENPSRSNLAELGIGCNPNAVITGNVLEDEKVGLHLAYGMSTHLGGKISSDIHDDICYSKGCPVEATTVRLHNKDGSHLEIIRDAMLCYDLLR
jgi:hypothetical protein